MTFYAVLRSCEDTGVGWDDIAPGKAMQNDFVESFNCRIGNECLNEHFYGNLAETRNWTRHGLVPLL